MKAEVKTLDAGVAGDIELDEAIFGLSVRADLLHRVINWQLAKRRAVARAVKERGDVAGTGKKFGKQKGGGRARHGDRQAPIFVGGGKAHGPKARSFAYSLPKKVRALGLKTALSAKQASGQLIILDSVALDEAKTKALQVKLEKLGLQSALVIDGAEVNANFKRAAANIPLIDVLPAIGANVYDILRRDVLVLTKAAVGELEARLK